MLRFSHFLDNQLTDGSKARAIVWLEGLGQLKKKSNDLIGT
jgi:hypothetical protein